MRGERAGESERGEGGRAARDGGAGVLKRHVAGHVGVPTVILS